MKKTKKFLLGLYVILFSIITISCENNFNDDLNIKTDIQFSPKIVSTELKSTVACTGEDVVSAQIVIDGIEYNPTIQFNNGELLTQAIKLNSGVYVVESFNLLDSQGNIVQATPADGSDFAIYVSETVPFELVVPEFDKIEVSIDVLCYNEADFTSFGFNWFNVGQVEVNELLFFGDLCYSPEIYVGSLYDQTFDLSLYPFDIIALFEVRTYLKDNGQWNPLKTFSNVSNPHAPLVTEWFTHSNEVLDFKFELWVNIHIGQGMFDWVKFDTWEFNSNNPLTPTSNNIVDFVIGDCVYSGTPPQFQYDPLNFILACDAITTYNNITSLFPESTNIMNVHTELFNQNNQLNVITGSVNNVNTDVWVEFIFEGAGWVNSFGYYTYEVGNEPTNPSQLTKTVIWPQVSDDVLNPGDLFNIGQLPENTVVGFYVVAKGWSNGQTVNGTYTHYSDVNLNYNNNQQHTLFVESTCNSLILTFEDIKLPSGDKDYNDIIIRITDNDDGYINQNNSFDLTGIVQF